MLSRVCGDKFGGGGKAIRAGGEDVAVSQGSQVDAVGVVINDGDGEGGAGLVNGES